MKQNLSSLGFEKSVPNFADAATNGFEFCLGCQRVTRKVQRGVRFVCVLCGSPRVKYCPPVSV